MLFEFFSIMTVKLPCKCYYKKRIIKYNMYFCRKNIQMQIFNNISFYLVNYKRLKLKRILIIISRVGIKPRTERLNEQKL